MTIATLVTLIGIILTFVGAVLKILYDSNKNNALIFEKFDRYISDIKNIMGAFIEREDNTLNKIQVFIDSINERTIDIEEVINSNLAKERKIHRYTDNMRKIVSSDLGYINNLEVKSFAYQVSETLINFFEYVINLDGEGDFDTAKISLHENAKIVKKNIDDMLNNLECPLAEKFKKSSVSINILVKEIEEIFKSKLNHTFRTLYNAFIHYIIKNLRILCDIAVEIKIEKEEKK